MRRIKLTRGKFALVDDCDYEYLSQRKWHAAFVKTKSGGNWYARSDTFINRVHEFTFMHREVGRRVGFSINLKTDHVDHNGLNNVRSNLRPCDYSQNGANRRKTPGCSSRFKGVHWYSRFSKWKAMIRFHGERIFLGHFDSEVDAAKAYDVAAKKLFGEFYFPNITSN